MTRKQYVLDTSALINDPTAWKDQQFEHCDVIIPIATLNELDKLKKQSGEVGKNARVCIRAIDNVSDLGDISIGVLLDNDALLKIDATYNDLKDDIYSGLGEPSYGDTQILACLIQNWSAHEERDVILVSNDINLRIKAKARGIDAIAHEKNKAAPSDMYSGVQYVVNESMGNDLLRVGTLDPIECGLQLHMHEFIIFKSEDEHIVSMGRKVAEDQIRLVRKYHPWGISPRNDEQHLAMDLLMDKSVDLVTLIGKAGCGKSVVTLACALELVLSKKEYEKLIIYRPIQSVGSDLGYLPGLLSEKIEPYFAAVMDSFEVLLSNKSGNEWKRDLEMYMHPKKGRIEFSVMTFIRGRSIPNSLIIVDECQNINKEDLKTILTRAGDGSKIILTGDINQIDDKLDASNNGLSYVIDCFKNSELAGHITFIHGERSKLATVASEIL